MSSAVTSVPPETSRPPAKFTPVPGVSRVTFAPAILTVPVPAMGRSPFSPTVPPESTRSPAPEIVLPAASVRLPPMNPSAAPLLTAYVPESMPAPKMFRVPATTFTVPLLTKLPRPLPKVWAPALFLLNTPWLSNTPTMAELALPSRLNTPPAALVSVSPELSCRVAVPTRLMVPLLIQSRCRARVPVPPITAVPVVVITALPNGVPPVQVKSPTVTSAVPPNRPVPLRSSVGITVLASPTSNSPPVIRVAIE